MHAAYGMRFVDMWDGQPVENVKAAWADTLAGFSYAELMRGLDNLPAKWPPDAVEFAALCRPRLGEPEALFFQALELQRLRHQGIDVRWPSATLFWAASIIGLDLQQYPYQVLKGRWLAALRQATDDVAEGRRPNHVPPPYTALPAPGCAITDTETAKKRLAEIKKLLK